MVSLVVTVKMPILAAGSNSLPARSRGFTLLETLVVLAILAMALAVVVPAVSRGLGTSLNDVARDMHTGLRKARNQAISLQHSTLFILDLNAHAFRAGAESVRSIPQGFELHARTASREMHNGQAGIRFYPDGSSSGGRLGISEGDAHVWLEVDWLTGRVSRVEE